MIRTSLIFLLLAFAHSVAAEQPWGVLKEQDGIVVEYRSIQRERELVEFRATTMIDARLSSLVQVIADVSAAPDWVYRVESAEPLERISDTERYTYLKHSMPLYLKDRDSILHSWILQDPTTLTVSIRGESAAHRLPESPDFVRISSGESNWTT